MYTAVTHDVRITVLPEYLADRSDPERGRYFWAYTIEITNLSRRVMQLISRHWIITDAEGRVEEVRGLGVIGEQPVLQPGETFRYTSGCPLTTSSGIMTGTFSMEDEVGTAIDVAIPTFSLDSPAGQRTLN